MSMQVGPQKGGAVPVINVTPLVDVVLVLLIIFMVVTPMLQKGKAVELPQAENVAKKTQPEHLIITVDKDKKIWIEKEEVPLDDLEMTIKRNWAMKPVPILVKADKGVVCEPVKKVMAALGKIGATSIALAAQKPARGGETE